ncbi:MAG TPA: hypothetical protein VHA74_01985 [Candidatus Dojkabacteria bacterium]|nr:hypothetical protein [Candidatus Dojkabacteria bacterium]
MNPRDLDPQRLVESQALTKQNGCTIFALTGAIAVLESELTEEDLSRTMKSIISVPVEETPLYPIAKEKNLPAPLLVDSGSVTAIKWIKEGEGRALMNYLNDKFSRLKLDVSIDFLLRGNFSPENILDIVKNGGVVLLPCSIFENKTFYANHHIALAMVDGDLCYIDVNEPLTRVESSLIKEMLANSEIKVPYALGKDTEISVNTDPIIYLTKKSN